MGFFSNNCKECGHPILCSMATNEKNYWMTDAVMIRHDNKISIGEYDGYGRVDGEEFYQDGDYKTQPLVYHEECWKLAGKPEKYLEGGSKMSEDQGWFFNESAHNKPFPKRRARQTK